MLVMASRNLAMWKLVGIPCCNLTWARQVGRGEILESTQAEELSAPKSRIAIR